jgi:hypothetical protein
VNYAEGRWGEHAPACKNAPLGEVHTYPGIVGTSEYRCVLREDGTDTGMVRRVCGRPVGDIALDLGNAIEGMNFEWATLGQGYKYSFGRFGNGDSAKSPCPDFNTLAIYVTSGGSEGRHAQLFMVKTFGGTKVAQHIARKLEKVLDVL